MSFLASDEVGFEKLWQQYRLPFLFGLFGVLVLSIGIFTALYFSRTSSSIEIVGIEEEEMIFVDLAGAILKPGVYELPFGSRYKDLLYRSGGLSALADRDWVEKNINLAEKLEDGIKVYIPSKKETTDVGEVAGAVKKININTASQSQLESLPGIGEVRAAKIIEERPYSTVEDLKTKKVISDGVFEDIEDKISVY
ncbi:ComEA family DNA-binding protein [Patescibacteria group bacterium]|nr:ComEA family DNA-binding protein [Patescibacteria group bacterium]